MGLSRCCILSCPYSRSYNVELNKLLSFFRFPKDPHRCSLWLDNCGLEELRNLSPEYLHKSFRICGLHFTKQMYMGVRLKKYAVPTLLAVPSLHLNNSKKIECPQDKAKEDSTSISYECPYQETTENPNISISGPDIKYKAIIQRIDNIERQNYELLTPQETAVTVSGTSSTLLDIDLKNSFTIETATSNVTENVNNSKRLEETPICFLDENPLNYELLPGSNEQTYVTSASVLRCRTCFDVLHTQRFYFVTIMGHLTKSIKDMIIFCIPQMALTLSDHDVVCNKCLDALQFCMKFIESCLQVEEKMKTLGKQEKISEYNMDSTNLSDIDYINIDHDYVLNGEPEMTENSKMLEVTQPNKLENLLLNNCLPTTSNFGENSESNQWIYKCPNCDRILKSQKFLTNHIRTVHSNLNLADGELQTDVSNYNEETNRELEEFLQIPDREQFKCTTCAKLFKTENYLLRHLKQFHDEVKKSTEKCHKDITKKVQGTPKYICRFCKGSFVKVGKYKLHLRNHKERMSDLCRICGLRFHNKEELAEHKNEHGIICSICFKGFSTRQEINDHKQVHPDIFFCKVCGKGFKMKNSLTSHAEVHKPYSFYCSKCCKGFKSKGALKYHEIIHDPEKKLRCDKCSSTFQDKTKLKLHQRVVHEKIREYQCFKCDRKFGLKIALNYHNRLTHLKLKMYQCENCGKRFGRQDYLKIHKLQHCKEAKKERLTMKRTKEVGSEGVEVTTE